MDTSYWRMSKIIRIFLKSYSNYFTRYVTGCIMSCKDTDGCNQALTIRPYTGLVFLLGCIMVVLIVED